MDMPVKHKKPSIAAQAAARTARFPKLPEHLLDGLVEGPMSAMEVEDLIDAFGKAVIERAMAGEMNAHLGYRAGETSLEKVEQSVQSWVAHASHAQSYGLRSKLLTSVRFTKAPRDEN